MSLSPLDMSLFDAFKDSKDVQDLMQSGFLLFSEKYMSKCIVITPGADPGEVKWVNFLSALPFFF